MIHYHGTPVSGSRIDAARFLAGRHAMISFFRPDDLPIAMDVCQSFAIDNGAFSHWRSGQGDIDVSAYADWVSQHMHHPGFDWCLIPDKIDGDENQNWELVQQWRTRNLACESVPVWHLHESLDYLNWLCAKFSRVALGSSGEYSTPGLAKWWGRIAEAMEVICDESGRPKVKIHGLRMLDPEIFTRLPFSSADSTNAAVNAGSVNRFGIYLPPSAAQRADVIASRIEAHNSAAFFEKQPQQKTIFA